MTKFIRNISGHIEILFPLSNPEANVTELCWRQALLRLRESAKSFSCVIVFARICALCFAYEYYRSRFVSACLIRVVMMSCIVS